MEHDKLQQELASYIGKLLRDSFGKGPSSVYVTIHNFIMTVYLRNFLSPTEGILMTQKQEKLIHQTRDLLMQSLIPEIMTYAKKLGNIEIEEFYYDWSFYNKTGLFVGVCSNDKSEHDSIGYYYEGKDGIHEEIRNLSRNAQKEPDEISSYMLNDRTLIVICKGILVRIEKEFIKMGLSENLKIAKRNLEKGLLNNSKRIGSLLKSNVSDIFIDWDFHLDKSIIVFVLNPNITGSNVLEYEARHKPEQI